MLGIIITLPQIVENEIPVLKVATRRGFRVHIRKPDASDSQIAELIDIKNADKYTVHYRSEIAAKYGCGLHCSVQQVEIVRNKLPENIKLSCSCHSWEEVNQCLADYVFLSPIFDSISKNGYTSKFDYNDLCLHLAQKRKTKIIALGGITQSNVSVVEKLGFDGWASLGYVWELAQNGEVDITKSIENLNKLSMKELTKLQYITRKNTTEDILAESLAVLEGGCKWIQLRMKDSDHRLIVETGRKLAKLCHNYGAIFIINDSPHTAIEVGADGVHLGKSDMPVDEARKILGNKIIGATANTTEDIINAYNLGADYIGLGPFRYTSTKKNLSPLLGIDGIKNVIHDVRSQDINIPIVTIGGITLDDCNDIALSGVDGIAISGAIGNSDDPKNMTIQFLNAMKK